MGSTRKKSTKPSKRQAKTVVRQVLEDTGHAYTLMCESHVNADFADYASSQALGEFRRALDDPNMSYVDLCVILRKASTRASTRQCKTPWSMFMANYISRHCNANTRMTSLVSRQNNGIVH